MASRRAKGGESLGKRPDGCWEGRYTVGTDDATASASRKMCLATQVEAQDKLRTAIPENCGPAVNFKGDYIVEE